MTTEPDENPTPDTEAEADQSRGPFVRPLSEPTKGTTGGSKGTTTTGTGKPPA